MTAPQADPFDARPLTEPVDPAAVRAFGKQLRAGGLGPSLVPVAVAVVGILVFTVVLVPFIGTVVASFGDGGSAGLPFVLLALVLMAAVAAGIVVTLRRWYTPTRAYRLVRFAQANGMEFQTVARDPALPGMIFQQGHDRVAADIVRGEHPRLVEFGNYRYETGSGKNRQTHRWGYIAIRLDAPLPNIVLDARSNNTFLGSNLPESLSRHQRLSLEGDFDKHFSLYAPEGYERDALYLFTPDIMARFVDHAAALDVEIIDDWLFLYLQRDVVTLDPAQWTWEFSVVGALLDKFAQWGRWRDERLAAAPAGPDAASAPSGMAPPAAGTPSLPFDPPPHAPVPPALGVAPAGRRLRAGVPVAGLVAIGAAVLLWLASQWGHLTFLFGGP